MPPPPGPKRASQCKKRPLGRWERPHMAGTQVYASLLPQHQHCPSWQANKNKNNWHLGTTARMPWHLTSRWQPHASCGHAAYCMVVYCNLPHHRCSQLPQKINVMVTSTHPNSNFFLTPILLGNNQLPYGGPQGEVRRRKEKIWLKIKLCFQPYISYFPPPGPIWSRLRQVRY